MLKHFSVLYAGHVLEGDGIGFDGVPANDRWYTNEQFARAFGISADLARHMESLGYDILWLAEHHFQREGYECIPNVLLLSLWLAQQTQRLKFGCAFNVLPMWHPLRLAEDFAMADILTNGRVIFGMGRGYHTREVETFGAPMLDNEANRELFEEQFAVLMKAFDEASFSHTGKHYTLPPEVPYRGYQLREITLVPRPLHRPVEVWQPIVSGTPRAFDFMARHGIKGVILGTAAEYVDRWIRRYQEANVRYGRRLHLGENLTLGLWCHVDNTPEQAKRVLQPMFEEHVKFAAPLGMLRYRQEQMEEMGPTGAARHIAAGTDFEDVLQKKAWICATPDQMVDYLKDIETRYPGLEHIMLGFPFGATAAQYKRQLTRFAQEVMPAFRQACGGSSLQAYTALQDGNPDKRQ
jgi:alkanesulfonate monooxygenase SsuD/methylene tetrahydromethanopterin reductase-like flavin-dependent oxidoreductase (luciferase family)